MFNLTVSEAALLLAISEPRVYQLIKQGSLEVEKVGSIWLISKESVDARLAKRPGVGRPPKQRDSGRALQTYTLLNRDHMVLDFKYNATTGEFFETENLYDTARAPLGLVSPRGARVSARALAFWWRHRAIPLNRQGMEQKLAKLGVAEPYQLPFTSFGLSLSDQYWIRPFESLVTWKEINYFDNDFGELHFDGDWLGEVGHNSPDNTSEGVLPKKWICEGDRRLLLKGGSALNQEPYNEVVATALFTRLLEKDNYVVYTLRQLKGDAVSICENFVSSEEEYIPAYYVRQVLRQANHHSDYQHYLECCVRLGIRNTEEALAKMIVCDNILGNTDRHWRNFGLIRNIETLKCRVAPLFDTGSSLWAHATEAQLRAGDMSFTTKPFYEDPKRQLRLVHDFSWLDPSALDGFVNEAIQVLVGNPALKERIVYVGAAIQERIDRIVASL